jgi:hypothetical protein
MVKDRNFLVRSQWSRRRQGFRLRQKRYGGRDGGQAVVRSWFEKPRGRAWRLRRVETSALLLNVGVQGLL